MSDSESAACESAMLCRCVTSLWISRNIPMYSPFRSSMCISQLPSLNKVRERRTMNFSAMSTAKACADMSSSASFGASGLVATPMHIGADTRQHFPDVSFHAESTAPNRSGSSICLSMRTVDRSSNDGIDSPAIAIDPWCRALPERSTVIP